LNTTEAMAGNPIKGILENKKKELNFNKQDL